MVSRSEVQRKNSLAMMFGSKRHNKVEKGYRIYFTRMEQPLPDVSQRLMETVYSH